MSYDMKVYNEALELRREGNTYQKVSEQINIPLTTLYQWCKGAKPLKFSEKHKTQRVATIRLVNEKNRVAREIKYNNLKNKITPEFAFVLGSILGDGSIVITKRDCRTMAQTSLVTKDKDFAEAFKSCLETWSGQKCKLIYYKETWQPWCYSLAIAKVLKEFQPNKISQYSEDVRGLFLRGLFDAEGSVDFESKRVVFTNTNTKLIELVKNLLLTFTIESRVSKVLRKERFIGERKLPESIVYYVRISRKRNLELFNNKIGFAIGRKQKLLQQILSSYTRAPPINWSKNDIEFLQSSVNMKPRTIAQKLGKSPNQVRQKRYQLKRSLI